MFSLANIVPQNPTHNRHLWADIETNVRYLTNRSEVYVVTGPLFVGSQLTALNERVLVPPLQGDLCAPCWHRRGLCLTQFRGPDVRAPHNRRIQGSIRHIALPRHAGGPRNSGPPSRNSPLQMRPTE